MPILIRNLRLCLYGHTDDLTPTCIYIDSGFAYTHI